MHCVAHLFGPRNQDDERDLWFLQMFDLRDEFQFWHFFPISIVNVSVVLYLRAPTTKFCAALCVGINNAAHMETRRENYLPKRPIVIFVVAVKPRRQGNWKMLFVRVGCWCTENVECRAFAPAAGAWFGSTAFWAASLHPHTKCRCVCVCVFVARVCALAHDVNSYHEQNRQTFSWSPIYRNAHRYATSIVCESINDIRMQSLGLHTATMLRLRISAFILYVQYILCVRLENEMNAHTHTKKRRENRGDKQRSLKTRVRSVRSEQKAAREIVEHFPNRFDGGCCCCCYFFCCCRCLPCLSHGITHLLCVAWPYAVRRIKPFRIYLV